MSDETKSNYSIALNWAALFVILTCCISLVAIICYLTLHDVAPIKNNVNVICKIKKDALTKVELNNYIQIIEKKISQNENSVTLIDKKLNEINSFYKLLGTIIAVILAITGFFGFKSLHEMKIRNLEDTKLVATNEANRQVAIELDSLKEKTISKIEEGKNIAQLSILSEHYKKEAEFEALQKNYEDLKKRLDTVENLETPLEDLLLRIKNLEAEKIDAATSTTIEDEGGKNIIENDLENNNDDLSAKDEFE